MKIAIWESVSSAKSYQWLRFSHTYWNSTESKFSENFKLANKKSQNQIFLLTTRKETYQVSVVQIWSIFFKAWSKMINFLVPTIYLLFVTPNLYAALVSNCKSNQLHGGENWAKWRSVTRRSQPVKPVATRLA